MRVPVRCCCDPNLVLGTLPYDMERRDNLKVRYMFGGPKWYTEHEEPQAACISSMLLTTSTVRFAATSDGGQSIQFGEEFALKSDETPLEALRQIPSFREINRVMCHPVPAAYLN